jgi:hypothetical protein
VDVELDPAAAALARALDRVLGQSAAESRAAQLVAHVQVFEPRVVAARPDAVAEAQLYDAASGRVGARRPEQVLRRLVGDQPLDG